MTAIARERDLIKGFVGLADTLVSDYDVADLLQDLVDHCVHLLQADAAGILLVDPRGGLQVMASSSEQSRLLELFQQQALEGPCVDCVSTGEPVSVPDLSQSGRWQEFVRAAAEQNYRAVDAVPLRLRDEIIGAMNLLRTRPGAMPEEDLAVGRALADVATIGILSERTIHHQSVVVSQLEGALSSRIAIEQAKGILAASGADDMDHAFSTMRGYARRSQTRLSEVATGLVTGIIEPAAIFSGAAH